MPRPKLPDAVRRSVVIRFSITQAQADTLDRRAAAAGLGREDYVRREMFDHAPDRTVADDAKPDLPDARVQEVQAALDAIAQPPAVCKGCGQEIDRDLCYCGIPYADHRGVDDHGFTPMGCDCGRAKEEPRPERARAIIAGGRHYILTDNDRAALDDLCATFGIGEVISGGATGADAGGEHWAKDRGIPVRVFHADWQRHGRAAGPLRNAAMADYLAKSPGHRLCILFPGGDGTESMRAEAVKRGIHIVDAGDADPAPSTPPAPVTAPTPCPKCSGAGRIGAPPVRFRCPVCAGSGKAKVAP